MPPSGAIVKSDLVAIGVGEGERAAERPVEGSGHDLVAIGDEAIMDLLHVGRMHPDSDADAGLRQGGEIGAGERLAQREGDRPGFEDDGMRRTCGRAHESEVSLIERLGGVQVAHLPGEEVGTGDRHGVNLSCVSYLTLSVCQNSDMSKNDVIHLDTSLGYLLKEASSALRAAMEDALRPFDMTVTHYSCLELLAQRPGLSNSDLARGAFVTRQSMNVLLKTLEHEGYVTRAAHPPVGKALPTRLTPLGEQRLAKTSAAVRDVERRMLSGLSPDDQADALRILRSMVSSLRGAEGANTAR